MSTKMSTQKLVLLVLYAVALAMGVAAIVLPLLGQSVDQTMIGIALFCLGVAGLNRVTEKS